LLTGRSLSAFKRGFKSVFKESPSRWLVRKRLQEAYFLVQNQGRKPSDIYLKPVLNRYPIALLPSKKSLG
jgi:AraC-like DNA-binding protein